VVLDRCKSNLVWLDLEMTGLNPEKDSILEIATVITNNELEIIATGPVLAIYHTDEELSQMDKWCIKQHNLSGLISAVRSSTVYLEEAANLTLEFLKLHLNEREAPLCGNSIWQDRNFLRKYMPKVDNFLNYRIIDVSSVKELIGRWYLGNPNAKFCKPENHRALEDTMYSIQELRHYRSIFFIPNNVI